VECILDSRIFRGKLEYLVHWKGYGIEEDEWRPSDDVKGAKRLVSEFHQQNPEAPQHISPSTSLNFPSAPLPISWTLQTQSPRIGLLADAHWDVVPLRGVNVRFVPHKVISSEPKSNLPSRTYVIRPIPRFDPHAQTIPVARDVRPSNI